MSSDILIVSSQYFIESLCNTPNLNSLSKNISLYFSKLNFNISTFKYWGSHSGIVSMGKSRYAFSSDG